MSAKIFKLTGYFVDPNGYDDSEGLKAFVENKLDLIPHHFKVEEQNVGEWEDENPLNYCDCPIEKCEVYFMLIAKETRKEDNND